MAFHMIDGQWHISFRKTASLAQKHALLISPFIQRPTLEEILGDKPKTVKIITRFNLNDFLRGVSDINALEYLLQIGAQVKGIKNLHSKVYIFGSSTAIVGSANLTQAALYRNSEFGIESDDTEFLRATTAYFDQLWNKAATLDTKLLIKMKREIAENLSKNVSIRSKSKLSDYGADLKFEGSAEIDIPYNIEGFLPEQYFVKFTGTSSDRASRDKNVKQEIERSGSHLFLAYPIGKRPRQVKNGDVIFIGRLVNKPDDIMIYGRVRGLSYVAGQNDATKRDIRRREWRRKWPHFISVYDAEFINGLLDDGISLNMLMRELNYESFVSTNTNALIGVGNINPRKAYMQKADVRLTPKAAQYLNTRLNDVFSTKGSLPGEEFKNIE